VATGNLASIEEWCSVDVACAHHLGDLLQNKHQLMLLPFTERFKAMQKILL